MSKMRGEIPFPQAGEGAFVRYSYGDLLKMEEAFGGPSYIQAIEDQIGHQNLSAYTDCLKIGLKIRSADDKIIKCEPDYEGDWNLADAASVIMDALCVATCGMTLAEFNAKEQKRQDKLKDDLIEIAKEIKDKGEDPFLALAALSELKQSDTAPD